MYQLLVEDIYEPETPESTKGPTTATVVGASRVGDKFKIDLQIENVSISDIQLTVTYDDGTTGLVTIDPTGELSSRPI